MSVINIQICILLVSLESYFSLLALNFFSARWSSISGQRGGTAIFSKHVIRQLVLQCIYK